MCIPCNLSTTKTHLLFLVLTCSFTATIWAAEGSSVVDVSAAVDRKSAIQADEKIPIIDFEDTPPPPSLLERSFQFFKPDLEWLSNSQKKVTYGVEVTARSIDNFFAGEESLELHNYSFLRIRLQPGFRRNHDDQFDTSVKFRIDLPLTKKRLRLVIGSDIDQEDLSREVDKPGLPEFNPTEDGSISAAIKAENRKTATWRASAKAGLKLNFPLDPFIRSTVWRRWELNETSSIPLRLRFSQFLDKGAIANASFNYEKIISPDYFFRLTNSTEWREEIDKMQAIHIIQLVRRITQNHILEHNFGILEQSLHNTVLTDAYIELDYRTLLHDNWLYLDIIPGIGFDRLDDYKPEPYLLLRLEMFFEKDSSNRTHWYYKN
ncbi:MAG: hypothetical protein P1U80_07355 [Pseudomonadales bacterium]|nr:hypothetical protein [Pseudomonadales bacterium]